MIRPMTPTERKASKEREQTNGFRKCVSCGNTSKDVFCSFCLEEE